MVQSRTLKHYGGFTAILAFCFQLVLSFGHIHPEEIFGRNGVGLHRTITATTAPVRYDQPVVEAEICEICAAASLLASGQLPEPAVLPVRETIGSIEPALEEALVPPERSFRLFQTRAPPSTTV